LDFPGTLGGTKDQTGKKTEQDILDEDGRIYRIKTMRFCFYDFTDGKKKALFPIVVSVVPAWRADG
jgi:hypothetical protein